MMNNLVKLLYTELAGISLRAVMTFLLNVNKHLNSATKIAEK